MKPIKIDIVSDVACPWCYIGKHRLETAIKQWKGVPIEVNWHPYQLDPTIPESGLDRKTYLQNKFGDTDLTKPLKNLVEAGESEGITLNFGEKWLAVNTLVLHQLLHVAGKEGFQNELEERFFKAYFDENLHLNNKDVLIKIMLEYGWSAEKTQQIITNNTIAETVKNEILQYQQGGVKSVPFFIINDKYGISGAQPPSLFLQAFEQLSTVNNMDEGDSCDTSKGVC